MTVKIFRLMKKWYLWRLSYIIVLPSLRGSRICNLWLSCINWRSALSTDVPLVDDIWTTSKTADLYVMFCRRLLFFVLICLSCLFLVGLLCKWHLLTIGVLAARPRCRTLSHALVITWKSVTIGARRGCCAIPTTVRKHHARWPVFASLGKFVHPGIIGCALQAF